MSNENERITMTQSRASVPARRRTTASTRADWLVMATLIALTAILSLAGTIRLIGLAGGAAITPDNARFFAVPLPVAIHILSALPFCILGAFQFAPGFRRRRPGWHRLAGRLVVLCGTASGLSGLWMAQFYPLSPNFQSNLLYGFRMLFGSAMVLSIALGLIAILRRDIARHRAWMIRGYAIGQGAGTQALTALLWMLIFGTLDQQNKDLLMGASWAINLIVAEWIIRRKSSKGRHKQVDKERDRSTHFDLGSWMARAQERISSTTGLLSHREDRSTDDGRAEHSMASGKASYEIFVLYSQYW